MHNYKLVISGLSFFTVAIFVGKQALADEAIVNVDGKIADRVKFVQSEGYQAIGKAMTVGCFVKRQICQAKKADGRIGAPPCPQCQAENPHLYQREAYDPSTGFKWCVDPETGEQLGEKTRGDLYCG